MNGKLMMCTILVVEYDPDLREDLAEILRYEGFRTSTAPYSQISYAMAREQRPDLIICGIQVQRSEPLDLPRMLREDPATAEIPLICLTTQPVLFDHQLDAITHADAILLKPFSIDDLFTAVHTHLPGRSAPTN